MSQEFYDKYYDSEQGENNDARNQGDESESDIELRAILYCDEEFPPLEELIGEIDDDLPNNDSTIMGLIDHPAIDLTAKQEEDEQRNTEVAVEDNAGSDLVSADPTIAGIVEKILSKELQEIPPPREVGCSAVEASLDKEDTDVTLVGDSNILPPPESVE